MNTKAPCPYCHEPAERVTDEVDIGVGVQEHFIGLDCTHCGRQATVCQGCGVWLTLQEHRTGATTEEECVASLGFSDEVPFDAAS